jgi:hypothetical protein
MSWEFITITHPKAAKEHRCQECGTTIERGERHSYTAGKVEGALMSYRLCEPCHRLAQAYCREINDDGWSMGDLRSDLRDEGIDDVDAWLAQSEAREAERIAKVAAHRGRVEALKGTVICARCGATIETYADTCSAELDDACPGFVRIEGLRQDA